jgi:cellulose synthase/poly-beta-1,6-N-acetylglucosamine synthase-like glycosyltransferase
MAFFIFYFSLGLLLYTYVVFSLLLLLRATFFKKPYESREIFPSVSMIIAAYNEAQSIESKIQNSLALDYPKDKFELIIASDGSEDETNAIVSRYPEAKLLALPRGGKHLALNAAVAEAKGEILVFSDANSIYAPDAIKELVRHFADEQVGGAAGDQRYIKEGQSNNQGERNYWAYDRVLKEMESAAGNVISATGAIYAIRRALFRPVIGGVTDDFYTSTQVILQGKRLVFAKDAAAYEPVAKSQKKEFGRKVRVMTRGLNAVMQNRALLNPFQYGFYALQLFTHKILRRLLFVPMLLIFISNFFLLQEGLIFQLLLLAQIGFYGLALLGYLLEKGGISLPKVLSIPQYVCTVYWAAALASWNTIRGHRIERWSTQR